MAHEAGTKIGDTEPQAQLVECVPDDTPVLSVDVSAVPPDASPVRRALDATIAQTGADPPPVEA